MKLILHIVPHYIRLQLNHDTQLTDSVNGHIAITIILHNISPRPVVVVVVVVVYSDLPLMYLLPRSTA